MKKQWLCARIYYFDPHKDILFVKCITPLYASLVEYGVTQVVLERHWQGGPHLALFLDCATRKQAKGAEKIVRANLEEFLAGSPSRRSLGEEDARKIHRTLSRYEASTSTYVPLHQDNTLEFSEEAPATGAYPSHEAWSLANMASFSTLPLVLQSMAEAMSDVATKRTIAIGILLTYAELLGPIEYSYFFMRAYVEKVIALSPNDPTTVRERLTKMYEQRRDVMLAIVKRHTSGSRSPLEQRWKASLRALLHHAQSAVAEGVQLVWRNDQASSMYDKVGWDVDTDLANTEFLTHWRSNSDTWLKFDESPFYRAHMFIVNQVYRLLHLLGINGVEKLVIFFILATAIEEKFGVDPIERIVHT